MLIINNMPKIEKAFEIIGVIWYIGVILFCISSFIQIFTGSKFGRQSELFDFVLSFNYLLLVFQHENLTKTNFKNLK